MIDFCEKCGNMMRAKTCPCQDDKVEPIDLIPKLISGEIRIEIHGKPVKVHPDVIKEYTDDTKKNNNNFDMTKLYNKALREFNNIIGKKR